MGTPDALDASLGRCDDHLEGVAGQAGVVQADRGRVVRARREAQVGYVDTDPAADLDAPKSDPRDVAALALDGVETGADEVLADDISRQVKAGLAGDLAGLYAQLAK